ncbi:pentapeptide repeat-containing protein [Streptomyces sp. H10-C2]|uniref:pentapeptide repeat-containing protein n=1 Tax=unclassified Streptomyces TaxID=2593676 RepID=UPI0024BBC796|nr:MULTISPECIES: pentapeptide repeat-containing protein [unclassified Streptomyces]MDJ0342543.1 pentapeptide repeat-containing protein [Streptomyces sp. PH10-H1]MDJ0370560.1 pentapeptide repeat-containing protein [Streptomyces sp. H10-C2]
MTPAEEIADLPYAGLLRPHEGGLEVDERYDTVHFDRLVLEDEKASGAHFLECAITDCTFTGTPMRGARFNDVWAQATRFTGTGLAESSWLDTAFTACALAGIEAYGSVLRRVVFRQCKFDSVNLRSATLQDVVFEDCVLRDVDLGGARLTGVTFPGTRLERVHLARATLKKADLRGAVTLDLADGYESLKGALISTPQLFDLAPALAQTLGITVKDK